MRAANLTWCSVCERWVGASRNWARAQAGTGEEWRVTRHATTPKPATNHYAKRPICLGSGILTTPDVVYPRKEVPDRG